MRRYFVARFIIVIAVGIATTRAKTTAPNAPSTIMRQGITK
jgi:hypothetical protein